VFGVNASTPKPGSGLLTSSAFFSTKSGGDKGFKFSPPSKSLFRRDILLKPFKPSITLAPVSQIETIPEEDRLSEEQAEQIEAIYEANTERIWRNALMASTALTQPSQLLQKEGADTQQPTAPLSEEELVAKYLDGYGLLLDTKAAFGVRPKPGSEWEKVDVENFPNMLANHALRREYIEIDRGIERTALQLLQENVRPDMSEEEQEAEREKIARIVVPERNKAKETIRKKGTPEAEEALGKRNLERYGDRLGPGPDSLYKKYKNWAIVIEKTYAPNEALNMLCGVSYAD